MLHKIRIALAATIMALAAAATGNTASAALAGYLSFGGYDRGGYEYSQETRVHDGGGSISSFGP
jgi:hypothetical protein